MEPIFEAILQDDKAIAQLLKSLPELVRLKMSEDYLVETIPHWLYVGDTPLHLAACALKTGAAKALLKNGAEVDAQNRRGATPLHYACDPRPKSGGTWDPEKQTEIIELLIKSGATIDKGDRGGVSPLHRAVRARSFSAVRQLLKSGASVDVRLGNRGSTPLHLAVQSTGAGGTAGTVQEQIEIIEILLAHSANPNAKDDRGRTVFDWTTNQQLLEILRKRNRKSSA